MTVDYSGESCRYDSKTNTYSRPAVKVRYPCWKCGSGRPEEWVQGASGGWKLEIGICCPKETDLETDS